jgi:hypothetical protein
MDSKSLPEDNVFDRSVEITLAQLTSARQVLIKLSAGHEPDPSLLGGLVIAMATNYLAESQSELNRTARVKLPTADSRLRTDPSQAQTWPALNQTTSMRVK